jgi:hypothetical protein
LTRHLAENLEIQRRDCISRDFFQKTKAVKMLCKSSLTSTFRNSPRHNSRRREAERAGHKRRRAEAAVAIQP